MMSIQIFSFFMSAVCTSSTIEGGKYIYIFNSQTTKYNFSITRMVAVEYGICYVYCTLTVNQCRCINILRTKYVNWL